MLYQSLMYPAVGLEQHMGSSFHHVRSLLGATDSLGAAHGLSSCGREGSWLQHGRHSLPCSVWDHSSLTRDQTHVPLHWKADSQQDHQGSPYNVVLVSGVKNGLLITLRGDRLSVEVD